MTIIERTTWRWLFARIWVYLLAAAALSAAAAVAPDFDRRARALLLLALMVLVIVGRFSAWLVYRRALELSFGPSRSSR